MIPKSVPIAPSADPMTKLQEQVQKDRNAQMGSFSQSKQNTNSNYASVNEQSGIKAGEGGFTINVGGNPHTTRAYLRRSFNHQPQRNLYR